MNSEFLGPWSLVPHCSAPQLCPANRACCRLQALSLKCGLPGTGLPTLGRALLLPLNVFFCEMWRITCSHLLGLLQLKLEPSETPS